MPAFDLGGRSVSYAVVKGTSRRYTYFRFRNDLTLEVVVPRGRPIDVEKAIRAKTTQLKREYDRMSRTRDVLSHDQVMFGGQLLRIVPTGGPGGLFAPEFSRREVLVGTKDRAHLRELVRRWFLKESSTYVVKKVAELAPRIGATPRRVDVREIGKWGYCTRDGRLSFSWQIVALPERLREYVVLHELTHLLEFNHSAAFKERLGAVCQDFRERERELDLIQPYDRLSPP